MIYFISDFHFFHDRAFIWKARGFESEKHMRMTYLSKWKQTIRKDDDVYVCGDFCLGQDYDAIKELIDSLPGKIHLIVGNHDTDSKIEFYKTFSNIVEIIYSTMLNYYRKSE